MDKDTLIKRKNELEGQKSNLLANLNACVGAINEIDYWLNQIDNPPTPNPPQGNPD